MGSADEVNIQASELNRSMKVPCHPASPQRDINLVSHHSRTSHLWSIMHA